MKEENSTRSFVIKKGDLRMGVYVNEPLGVVTVRIIPDSPAFYFELPIVLGQKYVKEICGLRGFAHCNYPEGDVFNLHTGMSLAIERLLLAHNKVLDKYVGRRIKQKFWAFMPSERMINSKTK